jgi:8-oxo-dGTP diphosphatase
MNLERFTSQLYWVVMAFLLVNLMQRKHINTGGKKRTATLIMASITLLLNLFFALILTYELPSWTIAISVIVTAGVIYLLRKRLFIFTLRCSSCGTRLTFNDVIYHDDNLCQSCRKELNGEEEDEPEDEPAEEALLPERATDVNDIDWDTWEPVETAVICYVFSEGKVMLINKKTGLGNGLINAPGGRIEEDETASEAAVRETEEETGITPEQIRQVGILNFQFTDGYSLKGYVFFSDSFTGEMKETDEADPFWVPVEQIPYDRMWEDDAIWLPKALAGITFEGRFIFDQRSMVSYEVIER